ncbi:hypothetical protein PR048_000935 [Dryococelus australis]|uniref:Uncharacterized protein n=1 Tax=Dryococelus australis TaxID=614101 RepID=A0ABQ9IH88_9NEOP|nr:hypothetical protein PR048_000935 [Dryococelus australis]
MVKPISYFFLDGLDRRRVGNASSGVRGIRVLLARARRAPRRYAPSGVLVVLPVIEPVKLRPERLEMLSQSAARRRADLPRREATPSLPTTRFTLASLATRRIRLLCRVVAPRRLRREFQRRERASYSCGKATTHPQHPISHVYEPTKSVDFKATGAGVKSVGASGAQSSVCPGDICPVTFFLDGRHLVPGRWKGGRCGGASGNFHYPDTFHHEFAFLHLVPRTAIPHPINGHSSPPAPISLIQGTTSRSQGPSTAAFLVVGARSPSSGESLLQRITRIPRPITQRRHFRRGGNEGSTTKSAAIEDRIDVISRFASQYSLRRRREIRNADIFQWLLQTPLITSGGRTLRTPLPLVTGRLLSLRTQPLIHSSTPTQLVARRPAAIFIVSRLIIWKVQRTLRRAERTRSVIQSILHISAENNYDQSPRRAFVIRNPSLPCLHRRRYRMTTLFPSICSHQPESKGGGNGRSREHLPTSAIVRHDSHLRKSGSAPRGLKPGSPWWETSSLTAQPPRPLEKKEGKGHRFQLVTRRIL